MTTGHNVDTLRDLIAEMDRRYTDNRKCDQEAVKLAKEAADKAAGTVNIVGALAFISLVLTLWERFG